MVDAGEVSAQKCPSCGSTELSQDTNGVWHCAYCRATFTFSDAEMIVVDAANVQAAGDVIIDTADMLTADQQDAIRAHFQTIKAEHDVVFALETVNTIAENVEYYARRRAQELGVGDDAKDNGVYILLVRSPHRLQIQAGDGISEHLSAGDINAVAASAFIPKFKLDDYVGGVHDGAAALVAVYEDNRAHGRSESAAGRLAEQAAAATAKSSGISKAVTRVVLWAVVAVAVWFLVASGALANLFGGDFGGGTSGDSGYSYDGTTGGSGFDFGGSTSGGGSDFGGGDFGGGFGGGADW